MTEWRIEGDDIFNPSGELVGRIIEGLPSIRRAEFIDYLVNGPRKAAARARYEMEENPDPDPPEDL